jgi:hypothetical protein
MIVFKIAIDAPKQENPADLSGQDNSILILCKRKINQTRPYSGKQNCLLAAEWQKCTKEYHSFNVHVAGITLSTGLIRDE